MNKKFLLASVVSVTSLATGAGLLYGYLTRGIEVKEDSKVKEETEDNKLTEQSDQPKIPLEQQIKNQNKGVKVANVYKTGVTVSEVLAPLRLRTSGKMARNNFLYKIRQDKNYCDDNTQFNQDIPHNLKNDPVTIARYNLCDSRKSVDFDTLTESILTIKNKKKITQKANKTEWMKGMESVIREFKLAEGKAIISG